MAGCDDSKALLTISPAEDREPLGLQSTRRSSSNVICFFALLAMTLVLGACWVYTSSMGRLPSLRKIATTSDGWGVTELEEGCGKVLEFAREYHTEEHSNAEESSRESAIRNFDDHYTYRDYKRDQQADQSSKSGRHTGVNTKVSASYGAFSGSIGVDVNHDTSNERASRAAFKEAKKNILHKKKEMQESSKSSGSSSASSFSHAETLHSKASEMYNNCLKYQQQDVIVQPAKPTWQHLSLSIVNNNARLHGVHIQDIEVVPPEAANCKLIGGDLSKGDVKLTAGEVKHVSCHRTDIDPDSNKPMVTVIVYTDIKPGHYSAFMPEFVMPTPSPTPSSVKEKICKTCNGETGPSCKCFGTADEVELQCWGHCDPSSEGHSYEYDDGHYDEGHSYDDEYDDGHYDDGHYDDYA